MINNLTILLVLLWLPMTTIRAQETLSPPDKEAIMKVLKDQEADWNRGDIPAFMEGYWKSDELTFTGSSGVIFGWEATRDRYFRDYPDVKAMGELHFEIIKMQQVGAGVAQVLGKFILTVETGEVFSGYFTLVWKKFGDQWLIVSDHTSTEK